jgi:hypothetical protein
MSKKVDIRGMLCAKWLTDLCTYAHNRAITKKFRIAEIAMAMQR